MAEAADLGLLVGLTTAVFELADQEHVAQPLDDGCVGDEFAGALGLATLPCGIGGQILRVREGAGDLSFVVLHGGH